MEPVLGLDVEKSLELSRSGRGGFGIGGLKAICLSGGLEGLVITIPAWAS